MQTISKSFGFGIRTIANLYQLCRDTDCDLLGRMAMDRQADGTSNALKLIGRQCFGKLGFELGDFFAAAQYAHIVDFFCRPSTRLFSGRHNDYAS